MPRLPRPHLPPRSTAVAEASPPAVVGADPTAVTVRRGLLGAVGWRLGGIGAVGVKELRGRMRGRRAFAVLTVYLLLLAGFAWMLYSLQEQAARNAFMNGGTMVGAQVGQAIFIGLLVLETLQLVFLAPASTAASISGEREHQTLDLLVATPIAPVSIVLGKLLSSLAYIVLLIVASIPLTAMVFLFGGVGPEDVVRGYVVLLVTALGFGSVGVFFSALVRRTQAATVLTYVTVLALTLGSTFVYVFWAGMTGFSNSQAQQLAPADAGGIVQAAPVPRPPEALLWLDPFVADVDVICGTEMGSGGACSLIDAITGRTTQPFVQGGPVAGVAQPMVGTTGAVKVLPDGSVVGAPGSFAVAPGPVAVQVGAPVRDGYWPRSALAWLVASALLVWAAVRMVAPRRDGGRRGVLRRRRVTA